MDLSLPSLALDTRFPAGMTSLCIIWQSRTNQFCIFLASFSGNHTWIFPHQHGQKGVCNRRRSTGAALNRCESWWIQPNPHNLALLRAFTRRFSWYWTTRNILLLFGDYCTINFWSTEPSQRTNFALKADWIIKWLTYPYKLRSSVRQRTDARIILL